MLVVDDEEVVREVFVGQRLAGFLQKPFTLQDLESKLRTALGPGGSDGG